MKFPVTKIYEVDWFRKCNGCVDFPARDRGVAKECLNCCNCPYAICGSHESKFRKE